MHTITIIVPIETHEWYDADGNLSDYGNYDAGGHYHPQRAADAMDALYDLIKEQDGF